MGWCERCGHYFILTSGRLVMRTVSARGRGQGITDVIDSVCPVCLLPDETYDQYGVVINKALKQEIDRANEES